MNDLTSSFSIRLWIAAAILAAVFLPFLIAQLLFLSSNVKRGINYQVKTINKTFNLEGKEYEFIFTSPKVRIVNSYMSIFYVTYNLIIDTFLIAMLLGTNILLSSLAEEDEVIQMKYILAPLIINILIIATILISTILLFVLPNLKYKKDLTNDQAVISFSKYRSSWSLKYGTNKVRIQTQSNGMMITTALSRKSRSRKGGYWVPWKRFRFYTNEHGEMYQLRQTLYNITKNIKNLEKEMQTRTINFINLETNQEISFDELKEILMHNAMCNFLTISNDSILNPEVH